MGDIRLLLGLGLLGVATTIAFAIALRSRRLRRTASATNRSISQMRHEVVHNTTRLVDRRSGLGLKRRLEQSGSQLRSGEWIIGVGLATLAAGLLGFALGDRIGAVLLAVIVPVIAIALLSRNIAKRQQDFADQLPDLLQNLSSALRSGQSLPQAVASIAPEMPAPASEELRRVVVEHRIGRDLVQSFQDLATRMGSIDFDWVVRAIDINVQTGGDLSVILRRLDRTIRARNHVAGAVRSLSAEGRISGVVLTALPIVMLIGVQFLNPEFLEPLFETTLGRFLLVGSGIQLLVGSFWLSRLAKFKF